MRMTRAKVRPQRPWGRWMISRVKETRFTDYRYRVRIHITWGVFLLKKSQPWHGRYVGRRSRSNGLFPVTRPSLATFLTPSLSPHAVVSQPFLHAERCPVEGIVLGCDTNLFSFHRHPCGGHSTEFRSVNPVRLFQI